MITRRIALLCPLALVVGSAHAGELEDKRLANRLELWANFAKRTRNLVVRTTTTRETSLLREPLVATGTLLFASPDTLVLRDDGLAGSSTIVDARGQRIVPNRAGAALLVIDPIVAPAAAWLGQRLRAAFAPGEGQELIADSRAEAPRGGHRLELLPPQDSEIRKQLRSLTLHFDAVTGSVIEILIAEVQGDRVRIQLADHRQNVPDADLEAMLAEVAALERRGDP